MPRRSLGGAVLILAIGLNLLAIAPSSGSSGQVTGLRTSEIFGLQWLNVDLPSRTTLDAEVLVRGEHKNRTQTAVARTAQLNSRALSALRRQRAFTGIAGAAVFDDPRYDKRREDERAFRRSFWTPILKQLRHSIEIYLTTYAKWVDGEQNALEMARLKTTLLSPSCPPQNKTGA
ncbi:Bbp50 [Burkholderia ubonensis]|nr:Bbp50 [Burkholderia ubonensis]